MDGLWLVCLCCVVEQFLFLDLVPAALFWVWLVLWFFREFVFFVCGLSF